MRRLIHPGESFYASIRSPSPEFLLIAGVVHWCPIFLFAPETSRKEEKKEGHPSKTSPVSVHRLPHFSPRGIPNLGLLHPVRGGGIRASDATGSCWTLYESLKARESRNSPPAAILRPPLRLSG